MNKITENLHCKKTSFTTEDYAEFYIKKLKTTSKRNVLPVRAYLCEKCFQWHLTHLQPIDVISFQFEFDKMKSKIIRLENELSEAKLKIKDRGQTINMLNKVIREFRMPKQNKPNCFR